MNTQTDVSNVPDIPPGQILGHPKALWQLSNINMWERFAYFCLVRSPINHRRRGHKA